MKRAALAAVTTALLGFSLAPGASAATTPFGRACTPQDGTRFCAGSVATRVPSWDGVPLDVDVTLPPAGDGPFPTIVMLHGYGGDKTDYEATSPEGKSSTTFHWNSTWFAQRGYAVVNYTARGFGDSCGSSSSRATPACAKGWIHLADQRYEAHDTQFLLGQLVDQGIAKASALGVTGISYGGGQSIELAYLRDRVRNVDDSFSPWKSPNGTPLSIAAAYPRWPWSDLVNSLVPNGRFLDFRPSGITESRTPLGMPKLSFISGLFASGAASGYYEPPGVANDGADLTTDYAVVQRGEPYGPDQQMVADEIFSHHQGFGIGGTPAPMLILNGWTDDLFPAMEALRVYNSVRDGNPGAQVALQFADLGHQRGSNKVNADHALNDGGSRFLDQHLKNDGSGPAAGSVTAFTQTCPSDPNVPAGGPFSASSWPAIHPGAVLAGSNAAQTVLSAGGNPDTARAIDPVAGGGNACAKVADETAQGTADYRLPVKAPFTLLGLPAVSATIATTGPNGQLDSRLWDVGPDNQQTLVSRGVYRLTDNQSGNVVFQLFGNAYRFEPGHTVKLELVGNDDPYVRKSNGEFSVSVTNLRLELPTVERPGATSQIGRATIGRAATPRLGIRVTPRRARVRKRVKYTFVVYRRDSRGHRHAVPGALVRFAHKRARTNRRGRAVIRQTIRRTGRFRARATRRGYRSALLRVRIVRR
ncbi:MAG: type transport system ATP-binding protein [Thermoleophilaceae bacterium]|nr:type transport system ATP-binding protein [Thermoleophilaceae bacterium]